MRLSNIKSFSEIPSVNYGRSKFDLSHSHNFTSNVGQLIPFLVDDILPGDSIDIKINDLTRLMTLINPIFDDLYTDWYLFFIPYRLLWDHFEEFMGENKTTYWTQPTTYSVPQIESPSSTGWITGTLADYMGCRLGVAGYSCNALYFRAYAKVVNDWFRDENLNTPLNCPTDDTTITGVNTDTFVTDCVKGGMPFVAPKFHDVFSSCLPQPQKGDPVTIGIGNSAPVKFGDTSLPNYSLTFDTNATGNNVYAVNASGSGALLGYENSSGTVNNILQNQYADLVTDLSQASTITINDLRYSFAVQRLLEKQARHGSRYIEILKSSFGVTSPDSRLQRSEYLGGHRCDADISTIVQTSQTDNTPLGDTAGYSASHRSFKLAKKSFTEHGVLLGLVCTRYLHSYSQGMEKKWFRKNKYDFYWTEFANIGEQPVLNKEIYMDGSSNDEGVFGYNEAWYDYRYKPNRVSGYMRPEVSGALSSWTLTDNYNSLPTLGSSWLQEDKANVDRVIAVQSSISHQLLHNTYITYHNYRVMPVHSIPRIIG